MKVLTVSLRCLNLAISHHGADEALHNWLEEQCERSAAPRLDCTPDPHPISLTSAFKGKNLQTGVVCAEV